MALFIGAIAAGVALLVFGWRGKRVGATHYCRKCGFDLTGQPTDDATCPECGASLERRRAIRVGVRRKRWLVALLGLLVFSGASAWKGVPTAMSWTDPANQPSWLLLLRAEHGPVDGAQKTLEEMIARRGPDRINTRDRESLIEDDRFQGVIERALALYHEEDRAWDPAWNKSWGMFTHWAAGADLLTPRQLLDYARATIGADASPLDEVCEGELELMLGIDLNRSRGGPARIPLAWHVRATDVRVDGEPAPFGRREVTVAPPLIGTKAGSIDMPAEPGVYTVRVTLERTVNSVLVPVDARGFAVEPLMWDRRPELTPELAAEGHLEETWTDTVTFKVRVVAPGTRYTRIDTDDAARDAARSVLGVVFLPINAEREPEPPVPSYIWTDRVEAPHPVALLFNAPARVGASCDAHLIAPDDQAFTIVNDLDATHVHPLRVSIPTALDNAGDRWAEAVETNGMPDMPSSLQAQRSGFEGITGNGWRLMIGPSDPGWYRPRSPADPFSDEWRPPEVLVREIELPMIPCTRDDLIALRESLDESDASFANLLTQIIGRPEFDEPGRYQALIALPQVE